jgi:hypothetical protein
MTLLLVFELAAALAVTGLTGLDVLASLAAR